MIRAATPADASEILAMIGELAEYERARDEAVATVEQISAALFGPNPAVYAHVAVDEATGETVGFALWFLSFSTWTGTHGIYLEDLYVRPGQRGNGHGRALLAELARICVDRGYHRLQWSVLNWNTPSIDFYKSLGAQPLDEWTAFRLSEQPLQELAAERG